MHRRDWLKSSGLILGAGFWSEIMASQTACHDFHHTSEVEISYEKEILRLSSNENPYGVAPKAKQAIIDAMSLANRYVNTDQLTSKIASKWKLGPENIILGAGSTEILSLCAVSHFHDGKGSLVTPRPTFFILPAVAEKLGAEMINVRLTSDKLVDVENLMMAIKPSTKMIYLCNPNNPTGTKLNHSVIKSFAEAVPKNIMLVVDEVYLDFVEDPSLIPLVEKQKNLIIIKSFSKIYGLAGMRLGYGVAHADTIKGLYKFLEKGVNGITQLTYHAGLAALDDHDFVKMYLSKNHEAKEVLYDYLKLNKVEHYYSHANCSVFSLDKFDKAMVSKLLSDDKIFVRQIDDWGDQYCRVSIGKPEDMGLFVNTIQKYLV
jgi:histidinol-phosphate aminotransferase